MRPAVGFPMVARLHRIEYAVQMRLKLYRADGEPAH